MPRDKTNTNAKIIQCMKEEFLTCGYEKASLNRVAAKVGITTAGLYKHFAGKEDMFYFLVKDAIAAFREVSVRAEGQMNGEADYNPFRSDWAAIWTELIYEHYEGVKLLICCAAGSKFESFEEDLIQLETDGNIAYANALLKSGKITANVSDLQWHMLSTAYVHLIFETVRHDMSKEAAAGHLRFVSELLYPGWMHILRMENE